MERTLPSQDIFSYAPKVLYIHKIFLENTEHILASHIILVDLLTLCRPSKLGLFQTITDLNRISWLMPKCFTKLNYQAIY